MNEQQLLALLQLVQNNPVRANQIIQELRSRQQFQQVQAQSQLSYQLDKQHLVNGAPWLLTEVSELDFQVEQAYQRGFLDNE